MTAIRLSYEDLLSSTDIDPTGWAALINVTGGVNTQQADPIARVVTSRDRQCPQRMGASSEKMPPQLLQVPETSGIRLLRNDQAWSPSESKPGGSVSRSSMSDTYPLTPHLRQRGLNPIMVGPSSSLVTVPQR
jgi:hypothetical protein